MAPEVFRHEPYNNKVDVYAFAMIAFQLFEGLPPFWMLDPVDAARRAASSGARRTPFGFGFGGLLRRPARPPAARLSLSPPPPPAGACAL